MVGPHWRLCFWHHFSKNIPASSRTGTEPTNTKNDLQEEESSITLYQTGCHTHCWQWYIRLRHPGHYPPGSSVGNSEDSECDHGLQKAAFQSHRSTRVSGRNSSPPCGCRGPEAGRHQGRPLPQGSGEMIHCGFRNVDCGFEKAWGMEHRAEGGL